MKVFKSIVLVATLAVVSLNVYAQDDKTNAINAYNEARDLASAKEYDDAISKYNEAIEIAEGLGAEGEDIKSRAQSQIPKIYFSKAADSYNSFRSSPSLEALESAIGNFSEAQEVGTDFGDEQVSSKARAVLAQLYYQKGTMLFKRENFEGAEEALNEAINTNSNYAKAYYQKGLVHKKVNPDDVEGIISWFDRAITVANTINDNEVVRLANNAAHSELLFRGSKGIENQNYEEAMRLLELSLEYNPESADSYYRLAEASNKMASRTEAIKYATNALSLEQGGNTDKAKIYFELGLAHQAKGNKADACDAFSSASYGSFKAPAEHKMEFELKCESAQPEK